MTGRIDRDSSRATVDPPSLRKRAKPTPASKRSSLSSSSSASSLKSENNSQSLVPDTANVMFTSRKYQSLPTSNGGSPRRRGPSPSRKYLIFGGLAIVACVVLLGGRHVATTSSLTYGKEGVVVGAGEAGDGLESIWDDDGQEEESEAFHSPPFNPAGSTGDDYADEIAQDEDEEMFHILPVEDVDEALNSGYKFKGSDDESDPEPDAIDSQDPHRETVGDQYADEVDESEYTEGHTTESIDEINEEESEEGLTASEEFTPATGPTSFETDPNPEHTTYCSEPYSPESPIIQYALVIDAGSTGSRIHVYKFNNCGPTPSLEYETFKAVQPGLSSFARDPTAAAASLDPLMEEAVRVVPESLHHCSAVEVKATAGLRLLPGTEGEAILEEVRVRLESDWPFALSKEDNAIEIMDGKDEGVYAWITANYLLGKIGSGTKAHAGPTIAVMDLGGASTQIVFEPLFAQDSSVQMAEGDHKYQLSFGGRDFQLYQHSYLGYGLMRARRSVNNLVAFTWSFLQPGGGDIEWDELEEQVRIPNPCFASGKTKRVLLDPPGRQQVNVTMVGTEGGYEACNRVVEMVMAKDAVCEVKPCSFNGVYQPSILDTFPSGQLLALSYFTDRIQPLLPAFTHSSKAFNADDEEETTVSVSDTKTLTLSTLHRMAKEVCAGPKAWKKRWGKDRQAMEELEDRPEYCLDLTFMHALLGLGYELTEDRELVVEKKLRGVELGWALGAGIALLEKATLTCTA